MGRQSATQAPLTMPVTLDAARSRLDKGEHRRMSDMALSATNHNARRDRYRPVRQLRFHIGCRERLHLEIQIALVRSVYRP